MKRFLRDRWDLRAVDAVITDETLSVLDVPCGVGRITSPLADRGLRVVGVDISAGRLGRGNRRLDLVQCDAMRLPFPDRFFDLVVSLRFLYHFPRGIRLRFIREMVRVTGRMLVLQYRTRETAASAFWRARYAMGLTVRGAPGSQMSTQEIRQEVEEAADLQVLRISALNILGSELANAVCIPGGGSS